MVDKKRYLRRFKGPSKKLASEFSDAVLEIGRIATSMQFLDTYRGDLLRHRDAVDRRVTVRKGAKRRSHGISRFCHKPIAQMTD